MGFYLLIGTIIFALIIFKNYEYFKKYEYEFQHYFTIYIVTALFWVIIVFMFLKSNDEEDKDTVIQRLKDLIDVLIETILDK